jgi:FKBP-type peptidyl-prolyl cis-trans isomerase
MLTRAGILTLTMFFAVGCVGASNDTADDAARDTEEASMSVEGGPPPVTGDTVTAESGLQYIVIREGAGDTPQTGQQVSVHYTGWLTDGTKFDSSVDRNEPYAFPIGMGHVIRGWDEGVGSMQVGEQRRLIIPFDLAYGEAGRGPIPPRATLIFDVELMGIQQ